MSSSHRWSKVLLLLRPSQSYKVGVVILPALFHGRGALASNLRPLLLLMATWWVCSALVYVLNDLRDLKSDQQKPHRMDRPLASGAVTPSQAWMLAGALALALLACMPYLSPASRPLLGLYLGLNAAYSLGLKRYMGLQQGIVAVGFLLRLQSGGAPSVPIPLTSWAATFTLGLAYFLNCMKGFGLIPEESRSRRWAMGLGAGLAGALALVALALVCFKRAGEGHMRMPELPPLFALMGMHRFAYQSSLAKGHGEQSTHFFGDAIVMLTIAGFLISFILA